MIEKEKLPILTNAEERSYLNKFFEYANFYSNKKSMIFKNKRETEDFNRNYYE